MTNHCEQAQILEAMGSPPEERNIFTPRLATGRRRPMLLYFSVFESEMTKFMD